LLARSLRGLEELHGPPLDDLESPPIQEMHDGRDRQGDQSGQERRCKKTHRTPRFDVVTASKSTLPSGQIDAQGPVDRIVRPQDMIIDAEPPRAFLQIPTKVLEVL